MQVTAILSCPQATRRASYKVQTVISSCRSPPCPAGLTVGGMVLAAAHGSSIEKPSAFGNLLQALSFVDGKGRLHQVTGPEARGFIGELAELVRAAGVAVLVAAENHPAC